MSPSPSQPNVRGLLVLAVVFLAFLPSLSGGWVWDDHWLVEPGTVTLHAILSQDIFSAGEGPASNLYRPLAMLPHIFHLSVLTERIFSLGLHLLAVWGVAVLGKELGAGRHAWMGAAFFGLHPATAECVAWITGRHDLLPALLILGGWIALIREKWLLAGILFALPPFAKEPYLLTPLLPLLWGKSWKPTGIAMVGVLLYLGMRNFWGLPLPIGAAGMNPIAPLGAIFLRGLEVLFVPATADALPMFHASFVGGICTILVGICTLIAARTHRYFRLLAGIEVLLVPCAPAAAHIGLVADRYFYLLLMGLGVGIGLCLAKIETRVGERWLPLAWLLPLLLAPMQYLRATTWESDTAVFGASLALNPENPYAAFHVAHDLQVRSHDCEKAIPLYQQALSVEPRAAANLQACFLDAGRVEEALALRTQISPTSISGALNTAKALGRLQRWPEAVVEAERATQLEPQAARSWTLLAHLALQAGEREKAKNSAIEGQKWLKPGEERLAEELRRVVEAASAP